jgi:aminocarboxymuconate-semialdehyde decarboxylase
VLLGSDYPYDMGTLECARQVRALSIPEADRATILGGLALKLLAAATEQNPRRQAGVR